MVQAQQCTTCTLQLHLIRPLLPSHALHRRHLLPHPGRSHRSSLDHRPHPVLHRVCEWRTAWKTHWGCSGRSGHAGVFGIVRSLVDIVHHRAWGTVIWETLLFVSMSKIMEEGKEKERKGMDYLVFYSGTSNKCDTYNPKTITHHISSL